jgi:quinol monooxygenase YgiN
VREQLDQLRHIPGGRLLPQLRPVYAGQLNDFLLMAVVRHAGLCDPTLDGLAGRCCSRQPPRPIRRRVNATESEPGTLEYALNADTADLVTIWLTELYADEAVLNARMSSSAMAEIAGPSGELLDGPADGRPLETVRRKGGSAPLTVWRRSGDLHIGHMHRYRRFHDVSIACCPAADSRRLFGGRFVILG